MSCSGCPSVKKILKKGVKIATGYAYLAGGINEDLSKQRMKICRNCPYFKEPACDICGCNMSAKTRLPEEQCPKNKWLKAA